MELILKAAGIALTAAVAGLIIRRFNPELSLALAGCTVAIIAAGALSLAGELKELIKTVKTIAGTSNVLLAPILKCVGVAIVTRLTAELCRDSSQAALASAVELAGTLCALGISMPLIMGVLKLIGDLV